MLNKKNILIIRIIFIGLIIFGNSYECSSQNNYWEYRVVVVDKDTKKPITEGVLLEIVNHDEILFIDSINYYHVDSLYNENYEIFIGHKGYFLQSIYINRNKSKFDTVFLERFKFSINIKFNPISFKTNSSIYFNTIYNEEAINRVISVFNDEYMKLIIIEGHCGSHEYAENDTILSHQRAETVRNILISRGIPPEKLNIKSTVCSKAYNNIEQFDFTNQNDVFDSGQFVYFLIEKYGY